MRKCDGPLWCAEEIEGFETIWDTGVWQFHGMEDLPRAGLESLKAAFDSRIRVGVVDKKVKGEAHNDVSDF